MPNDNFWNQSEITVRGRILARVVWHYSDWYYSNSWSDYICQSNCNITHFPLSLSHAHTHTITAYTLYTKSRALSCSLAPDLTTRSLLQLFPYMLFFARSMSLHGPYTSTSTLHHFFTISWNYKCVDGATVLNKKAPFQNPWQTCTLYFEKRLEAKSEIFNQYFIKYKSLT